MAKSDLIMAVGVTAELCATAIGEHAALVLLADLEGYPEHLVMAALVRCRREVKPGRFSLSEVIARIDDGHPGPEEAWSIAMLSCDERETVVWTPLIAQARDVAYGLLLAGDGIGARMAFKEAYGGLLEDAKLNQVIATWSVSMGDDLTKRSRALLQAQSQHRITNAERLALAPPDELEDKAAVDEKVKAGQLLLSAPPEARAATELGKPTVSVAATVARLKDRMTKPEPDYARETAERLAVKKRKAYINARVQAYLRGKTV